MLLDNINSSGKTNKMAPRGVNVLSVQMMKLFDYNTLVVPFLLVGTSG